MIARTNVTPRILLTGFGPFPGVAVNASALLAERLAEAVNRMAPGPRITCAILPTEWERGPRMLDELWDRVQPDIAIHFGVSERAPGFVVETRAHNQCQIEADACGALPGSDRHPQSGPQTFMATLPASSILLRLAARAIPCCSSTDAGAYLCNAILYRSIARAEAAHRRVLAGFIHIPSALAAGGPNGQDALSECPLTWESALAGGQEIINAAVSGFGAPRRWPRTRSPRHLASTGS